MNTPPKIRRYRKPPESLVITDRLFVGVIDDAAILKALSRVLTGFVYLEQRMASVLAVLLGSSDKIAASYVMRAIKSPSGRIDVMKELLECAPINEKLGPEYDAMLKEFRSISTERNIYAHGRWWTDVKNNETLLDETEDLAATLLTSRVVREADLKKLDRRIFELHKVIGSGPEEELKRRQKAGRQQRREPRLSKRPRQSARTRLSRGGS